MDLPYAEAVFDISYFRNNPLPFYTLAHELYPGKYRPTIAHSFIRLLYEKGRLLKLFTQNIDCLEQEAGVPPEMIVAAHGSFATQRCIDCKTPYPEDLMKKAVAAKEVPHCRAPECNGLVKPDIVFFGEALPEEFHRNHTLPAVADLCIIMGTSLTVQPFASLPAFVSEQVPRVLINLERVGGLGSRADDVMLLGDCDDGVRKFADALGWRDELESLWESTKPSKAEQVEEKRPERTKDEKLQDEVDLLTEEVDKTLKISNSHHESLKDHLEEKHVGKEQANETGKELPAPVSASKPKETVEGSSGSDKSPETGKADMNSEVEVKDDAGGLKHVFPHIAKKPSL